MSKNRMENVKFWEEGNIIDFGELIYAESEEDLVSFMEDAFTERELKVIDAAIQKALQGSKEMKPTFKAGSFIDIECTSVPAKAWQVVDELKIPLDCCAKPTATNAVAPVNPFRGFDIFNSKESYMLTNTTNLEADTRKYLLNRLSGIEMNKRDEAEAKFLPVTETPKTGKALKEALSGGWLKVNLKDDDKLGKYDSWMNFIELQDPSRPRDPDAYYKAVETISGAALKTKDTIMVLPQADGLAALKAFEGTTYH